MARKTARCQKCNERSKRMTGVELSPCTKCGGEMTWSGAAEARAGNKPKNPGRYARNRGFSAEREFAMLLQEVYPNAHRGAAQSRKGGQVADIEGTPWWAEGKRRKRLELQGIIEKAEQESAEAPAEMQRPALVLLRCDDDPDPIACLRLSAFLELVRPVPEHLIRELRHFRRTQTISTERKKQRSKDNVPG